MGVCCSSAAAQDNSPYQQQLPRPQAGPNNDPAASTRPINSSQPQLHPRPSTTASNQSGRQHHGHGHRGVEDRTNRPNKPLRIPRAWSSVDKTWTRSELDRERKAFFDTRVTNEAAIWNAINQACEVLWSGGDSGDDDAGLGTAQTILDAAEITLPSGDLVAGCYDRLGNHYRLPAYVVSDPMNLAAAEPTNLGADGTAEEGVDSNETAETEDDVQRRREAKGKAVEDLMVIEIKRSDLAEKRHKIQINRLDPCRVVAQKIEEQTQLNPTKTVRLYYRGKKLKESMSLIANDWKAGDIISAMVFERDRAQWGT